MNQVKIRSDIEDLYHNMEYFLESPDVINVRRNSRVYIELADFIEQVYRDTIRENPGIRQTCNDIKVETGTTLYLKKRQLLMGGLFHINETLLGPMVDRINHADIPPQQQRGFLNKFVCILFSYRQILLRFIRTQTKPRRNI